MTFLIQRRDESIPNGRGVSGVERDRPLMDQCPLGSRRQWAESRNKGRAMRSILPLPGGV